MVAEVKNFAKDFNSDKVEFKLATGNMGVAAATNEGVDKALGNELCNLRCTVRHVHYSAAFARHLAS